MQCSRPKYNKQKIYLHVRTLFHTQIVIVLQIIIQKISSAPIYCTRWERMVLYKNSNHTHSILNPPPLPTATHTYKHTSNQGCNALVKYTINRKYTQKARKWSEATLNPTVSQLTLALHSFKLIVCHTHSHRDKHTHTCMVTHIQTHTSTSTP